MDADKKTGGRAVMDNAAAAWARRQGIKAGRKEGTFDFSERVEWVGEDSDDQWLDSHNVVTAVSDLESVGLRDLPAIMDAIELGMPVLARDGVFWLG